MDKSINEALGALNLNEQEMSLLKNLASLKAKFSSYTRDKFKRLNPWYEDLFSWKVRGEDWSKEVNNITIYNSTTVVGDVKIGKNTWIGPFCSIDGTGGLEIGEYCSISAGVQIVSHDTVKYALSGGREPYVYGAISIGNNCFLGSHAVITKGVSIGDRCVVAAGAVVLKDIPNNSIVAGVPAVVVGVVRVEGNGSVVLDYA